MKTIIKSLGMLLICLCCYSCFSSPQTLDTTITMDPIKDAQTCIKLYEKDPAKGKEYMENVIITYYMEDKNSKSDKFASIVTEEIAKMSFQ